MHVFFIPALFLSSLKIFVNLIEQGNLISADMTNASVMYAVVNVNIIIFCRNIGAVSTVLCIPDCAIS